MVPALKYLEAIRSWIFSLEGKFILAAAFSISVIATTSGYFIIHREEVLYKTDAMHQLHALADVSRLMLTNIMVYNEIGAIDNQDLKDYLIYFTINLTERDSRVVSAMVLDNDGTVIANSRLSEHESFHTDDFFNSAMQQLIPVTHETSIGKEEVIILTTPLNISTKKWGALRLVYSKNELNHLIYNLRKEILIIVCIVLVLSLIMIKIVARHLSKPVVALTRMMDGIHSYSDLELEVHFIKRRDELGKLQNSFSWLIKRLQESDREREKAVEKLVQNEKLVALGFLSSGVAHEINNPLGGIMICFQNLLKSVAKTPDNDTLVFAIEDGLRKIKGIVAQLLDFSRSSSTQTKPVQLNDLISRLLLLLRHDIQKRKIEVSLGLSEHLPMVVCDENKIFQVFMNLVINAMQSMEHGGILTISTCCEVGACRISFSDTGEGILPENMPFIFDPFFTTKATGVGTGLGLSVSRGIIEQHDGRFTVESTPGQGATFTIILPDVSTATTEHGVLTQ